MARSLLAAVLVALLVVSASPVGAHGNHVEVDSQHSADGVVRVEAVMPLVDGFVVLHRTGPDGGAGEPIGHTKIQTEGGYRTDVPVEMNESAWADWGANETVWVVYHEDNGDPSFDPDEDPALSMFGSIKGTGITLSKGDAEVSVLAERSRAQRTANATAVLNRVALDTEGFVVVRNLTQNNSIGPAVGVKALDAGVHDNVTVPIDEAAFPDDRSTIGLYAQVYADDGDGEFTDADRLVHAGDDEVRTYFLVEQVEETDGGSQIRTPDETTGDVVTATEDTATTTRQTGEPADGGSGSGVAGFGLAHGVVAALAAAALLARR